MLAAFEKNLIDHELLKKGDSVVVAVSGGADSLVLLDLLSRLQKSWQLSLHVAHVNHGLRGQASDSEEKLVRTRTQNLKIPFHLVKWKAPKRGNIQNEARKFRYGFFRQTAVKFRASCIATAHHRDDQAETVLLQLIRGTGMKGLSGISFASRYKDTGIIHPLLDFSRQQIEAYAKRRKIRFARDESNDKTDYRRNLIRHKIIPMLESINPRVTESISDVAFVVQSHNSAMEAVAKTFADEFFFSMPDKITWHRSDFVRLPSAIRRQVLVEAFERMTGDRLELNSDQIRNMEKVSLTQKDSGQYMLPRRRRFYRNKDLLYIQSIKA